MGQGREEDRVKKQNRTENSERGWAGGVGGGRDKKKKKGGAAYTQGIYFYTHLYTHLDIVHVKIYAIHTPASCQVPREPVVTALAAGEQRALLNIHSKVYVHMYTYVQTPPPAPGHWTQARPRTHNPWKPLSVLNFLLLKEEGAGEKRKTGVWSAGTVASPRSPKDQLVLQRRVLSDVAWGQWEALRLCVRVRDCV